MGPKIAFRRRLGTNTTCSPIWNGLGSDKRLTLHPLLVGFHQATWRGFYTRKDSRNGQTFSSLTGRTSGLPVSVIALDLIAPRPALTPARAVVCPESLKSAVGASPKRPSWCALSPALTRSSQRSGLR